MTIPAPLQVPMLLTYTLLKLAEYLAKCRRHRKPRDVFDRIRSKAMLHQ
jgi:hypothetical protein